MISIPSGLSNTVSKIFTKLGDNTGSVVPMYVKDFTSDTFTTLTYHKEGGNQDWQEKALEEFGTGVLWLGGIPFLKKTLFDNFLYKKLNINPAVDAKRLFSGSSEKCIDTVEFATKKAAELGAEFSEQKDILSNTILNKNTAKKLSAAKFGVSTALTGIALFALITLKQKRTEAAIEKQVKQEKEKSKILKNAVNKTEVALAFKSKNLDMDKTKTKQNNAPAFGNLITFFMTNPIANTSLVDGVITSTRLIQARKGEKLEVGFKELCELAFIYGLAAPLQIGFEKLAGKFNRQIQLDYSVLNSDIIKKAIDEEKVQKGSSKLLSDAKKIIELAENPLNGSANSAIKKASSKVSQENGEKIIDFVFGNANSDIAKVFKQSGDIGTFKTKEGIEQLSLLSSISPDKLKNTSKNVVKLIENAANSKSTTKYLGQTKVLKGSAIVLNILISALLMGYLQPKINILMRKFLHGGDNTNPAIKNIEKEIKNKLAFEGENENK